METKEREYTPKIPLFKGNGYYGVKEYNGHNSNFAASQSCCSSLPISDDVVFRLIKGVWVWRRPARLNQQRHISHRGQVDRKEHRFADRYLQILGHPIDEARILIPPEV